MTDQLRDLRAYKRTPRHKDKHINNHIHTHADTPYVCMCAGLTKACTRLREHDGFHCLLLKDFTS